MLVLSTTRWGKCRSTTVDVTAHAYEASQARRPCGRISDRWRLNAQLKSDLATKQAILEALSETQRGVIRSSIAEELVKNTFKQLNAASGQRDAAAGNVSSTWKLLWTTEKETLFLLEKAGLFGTRAGDVFQVIDVTQGSLQNVITFPPEGAFIVNSTCRPANGNRVQFKFTSAKLKLPNTILSLPPFGSGWFESVYVDDLRIAYDSRGDMLVVARDGPPRVFA